MTIAHSGIFAPSLFIDDAGKVWHSEPGTIVSRFGPMETPRDFVLQGVRLGFIFVDFCGSGVRIALVPRFVTRRAISRLAVLLGGRNPPRVALSYDGLMSSWELIIGAGPTIARIYALVAEARRPDPRSLLHSVPLPLERCCKIDHGRLLPVLKAWAQRRACWDADIYQRLDEAGLLSRTIVARQSHRSERLVIEYWGANNSLHGRAWLQVARGRDYEDQPNIDLGQWRASSIRQTIAEGVPRLSSADFVIRTFDSGLVRMRHCRLALPWRDSDGAATETAITVSRRVSVLEKRSPSR